MDVSVEVIDTQNGQPGSIKVSTNDGNLKFFLHLLDAAKGGKNAMLKITNGTIENIPKGTYDLIIHSPDATYCSETRKVTVN